MDRKGTAVLNVDAVVAEFANRSKRLREIVKQQGLLAKQRAQIEQQQNQLSNEVQRLMGTAEENSTIAPRRRGRKPGRKPKAEKTAKNARKANGNGEKTVAKRNGRGRKPSGESLRDVLLTVLPSASEDPISKDEIVTRLTKKGYKSTAKDPKVVIGQALGKHRDFSVVERGKWRLSATGVKNRDKMVAPATTAPVAGPTPAPVEAAAETASAETAAAAAE